MQLCHLVKFICLDQVICSYILFRYYDHGQHSCHVLFFLNSQMKIMWYYYFWQYCMLCLGAIFMLVSLLVLLFIFFLSFFKYLIYLCMLMLHSCKYLVLWYCFYIQLLFTNLFGLQKSQKISKGKPTTRLTYCFISHFGTNQPMFVSMFFSSMLDKLSIRSLNKYVVC